MKKSKKTRMFNFLVELLLVIVIFAISSLVVVKMFYHGQKINTKNQMLNEAMFIASDIAEQMRLYDGQDLAQYLSYDDLDYDIKIDVNKTCDHYCLYETKIEVSNNSEVLVGYEVASVGENYE